jgi:hypothetical protein
VSTLAHLARFIIADITDPRSVPQELMAMVPTLPVQPLLKSGEPLYGLLSSFSPYPWVLTIHHYRDSADLIAALPQILLAVLERIRLNPGQRAFQS